LRIALVSASDVFLERVRLQETIVASVFGPAALRRAPLARTAGIATDPQGRIFVDPHPRSISHPRIHAVGDAAHPIAPTGAPYRISAFAALISGAYAAGAVLA
jgi:NADH dehydrogenase FAD-containing subunit